MKLDNSNSAEHKSGFWSFLFAAWLITLMGSLGSLFFSEVMDLPPCVLCWYQRIALYPLVFVLGTGYIIRDKQVLSYAWPLIFVGGIIALYHNLLYYGVIPESISPCREGVSCTEPLLTGLGFISIPLLSLGAFLGIGLILILARKQG